MPSESSPNRVVFLSSQGWEYSSGVGVVGLKAVTSLSIQHAQEPTFFGGAGAPGDLITRLLH